VLDPAAQAEFAAEYEAYVARQREAEDAIASGEDDTAADSGDEAAPSDSWSFRRELTSLIDGIRDAENVLAVGPDDGIPDSGTPRTDGSSGDTEGPGENPFGVSVGEGTRFLRTPPLFDLASVELPRWFPPELPVTVTFTVASDGTVYGARVPPGGGSLVAELDTLLAASVERWRFDPAPEGSRPVAGSVTIIVETDG